MEKDMKMAAQMAIDEIEQLLPPMDYNEETENAGRHHALNEYGLDLFKAGAKWALEMLWSDLTEAPEKSDGIIILDDRDEIRQCKKDGSYYEDKKDGLPMLNDEVCSFISIESLHKKLTEGLW